MRCELCRCAACIVATVPRPRGIIDRYALCRACAVVSLPQIRAAGGEVPDLPAPPKDEDDVPRTLCHQCGAGVRGGLPLCGKCREALRAATKHHLAGGQVSLRALGARAAMALPAEVAEGWGPAGLRELRAALGGGA